MSACCARRRRSSMKGMARPILLGRRTVIESKVREMGLRIDLTDGVRVLDPAGYDGWVRRRRTTSVWRAGADICLRRWRIG